MLNRIEVRSGECYKGRPTTAMELTTKFSFVFILISLNHKVFGSFHLWHSFFRVELKQHYARRPYRSTASG